MVEYSGGRTFDPCRAACEADDSRLDVSPTCVLFSEAARDRYFQVAERAEEVGYEATLRYEGCGCLWAEVSAEGVFTKFETTYSTSDDAVDFLRSRLGSIDLGSEFESCLAGSEIPVVFGHYSREWLVENRRRDLIVPIYDFIAAEGLARATNVPYESRFEWLYLNIKFGILYIGNARYLAEASYGCLSPEFSKFVIVDSVTDDDEVDLAHRISIGECPFRYLYPISSFQEGVLMRMAMDDGSAGAN